MDTETLEKIPRQDVHPWLSPLKGIERHLKVIAEKVTKEAQQGQMFKAMLQAKVALLEEQLNTFWNHLDAAEASQEVRRQRYEQDVIRIHAALREVQHLARAEELIGLRTEIIERLGRKLREYSEHCEAAMKKADSSPKEIGQMRHLLATLTQDLTQLEGL